MSNHGIVHFENSAVIRAELYFASILKEYDENVATTPWRYKHVFMLCTENKKTVCIY